MNITMPCLLISPLSPLKGKIASKINQSGFDTNTPFRGMGVIKYDYKLFP
jgi:hypothetical protein